MHQVVYDEDEYFEPTGNGSEKEKAAPDSDQLVRYNADVRQRIWTQNETGHELTLDEMLFVRSYVIDRNPVAALRRLDFAGPPHKLKAIAERYLQNPEVSGAVTVLVKRVLDKLDVTAEKVIGHLAAMAFFDPRTITTFDGQTMQVLDSRLWPDEAIAAVQSIKMTKDAGVEIKFADKLAATKTLGQQLNLLQDPDEAQKKAAADAAAEAALDKMAAVFERVASNKVPDKETSELPAPTVQ